MAPSNDDDHFIEMPVVAGSRSHLAQVASDRRTEFEKPAPDGFVRDIEASLCKQILHVSIAQSEAGIEPNGMANDVRWEAVALKADFVHLDRLPQMPVRVISVNVTMPFVLHLSRRATSKMLKKGSNIYPIIEREPVKILQNTWIPGSNL